MIFGITLKELLEISLAVAVFIIMPIWFIVGFRAAAKHQARIRSGICPNCGYDLRGSAQSNRCPECGEQITRYP